MKRKQQSVTVAQSNLQQAPKDPSKEQFLKELDDAQTKNVNGGYMGTCMNGCGGRCGGCRTEGWW